MSRMNFQRKILYANIFPLIILCLTAKIERQQNYFIDDVLERYDLSYLNNHTKPNVFQKVVQFQTLWYNFKPYDTARLSVCLIWSGNIKNDKS